MADSRKPSAAFWTAVALTVLIVGYPLSLGPACWISSRAGRGENAVTIVYRPILWNVSWNGRQPLHRLVTWYSKLCARTGWEWYCFTDTTARAGHTPWQWGHVPTY
jgi:hypothetical protein